MSLRKQRLVRARVVNRVTHPQHGRRLRTGEALLRGGIVLSGAVEPRLQERVDLVDLAVLLCNGWCAVVLSDVRVEQLTELVGLGDHCLDRGLAILRSGLQAHLEPLPPLVQQ